MAEVPKTASSVKAPAKPTETKPVGTATVKATATAAEKTPPAQQVQAARPQVRPLQFRIERGQRRERFLKLMIYGNYGVGKTTLACSALQVPSMADVLMINAEAGDLSVEGEEKLDAITVQDFRTLSRVHEYLKQHCKARDENNEEFLRKSEANLLGVEESEIVKPRHYRTCVVDTLSEIEAYCFNQLLGISDTTKLDDETQSAEWAEYKKNHSMMLRLVRKFRDLPMHVIFTCGEQYNQDETKKYKYSPDLTGKLSKKVQGFMDMVGYFVMAKQGEQDARVLYVQPSATGKFDAKHRYWKFKGNHFLNPSIAGILKEVGLLDKEGAALK